MHELIEIIDFTDSKLLISLLGLVVYILGALLLNLFINKVLRKLVSFTKSDIDDKLIDISHMPVFWTIIFIGLNDTQNYLLAVYKISDTVSNIIFTVVALLWAATVIGILKVLIEYLISKLSSKSGLSMDLVPLLNNVMKLVVIGAGIMVILAIWSVDITPLLASAGIVSVVVALAAKDTMSNFFGGISVFVDKPYKIGDYIILDQQERGEVVNIGIRSTRIKTRDDVMITIPNAIIANSKIVNESAPIPNFRVRIPIGIAYGSDVELVEKILVDIATRNENIISTNEPRVRFRKFGDSSLDFELLCWVKEPSLQGLTVHEINKEIDKKFKENGISIPFPQRDLHIKKDLL